MSHVEDRWKRDGRTGTGRRWRARYLDPDGAERSRSFATKVMAEKFLTEVEHSKLAGSYRDPDAGNVTLRKYAAGWVAGYHPESTRGEKLRSQLANHILPGLGAARWPSWPPGRASSPSGCPGCRSARRGGRGHDHAVRGAEGRGRRSPDHT